jgi:hypothetical protein
MQAPIFVEAARNFQAKGPKADRTLKSQKAPKEQRRPTSAKEAAPESLRLKNGGTTAWKRIRFWRRRFFVAKGRDFACHCGQNTV